MKIKLSKSQWEEMGKRAGWMKEAAQYEANLIKKFREGVESGAITIGDFFYNTRSKPEVSYMHNRAFVDNYTENFGGDSNYPVQVQQSIKNVQKEIENPEFQARLLEYANRQDKTEIKDFKQIPLKRLEHFSADMYIRGMFERINSTYNYANYVARKEQPATGKQYNENLNADLRKRKEYEGKSPQGPETKTLTQTEGWKTNPPIGIKREPKLRQPAPASAPMSAPMPVAAKIKSIKIVQAKKSK